MDEVLQKYLKSVEEEVLKYKENTLETKEYLQSMQEIEKWLKDRCDENRRN